MREFIFSKKEKIVKRKEYLYLKEHGKKIQDNYFIVIYKNNQLSNSRLGITVSSKVGGAVRRNRLKRLIREAYRLNRDHLTGQIDINFIAKKNSSDINFERVSISMRSLLSKAGNTI